MGSEHLKSLSRNDPCWCGSGKKYKKCHLNTDEALARDEAGKPPVQTAAPAEPAEFKISKAGWMVVGIGLAICALTTVFRSFGDGLIAGAAVIMVGVGYLIVRDPPPPNVQPGDPAALNFGMTGDDKTPEQTQTRVQQQNYRGPQRRR